MRSATTCVPIHHLVMLAHAILTVIAAHERERNLAGEPGLMALTVNEIRRLFAKLITDTTRPASFHLAWSRWRRLHQARARASTTAPEATPGITPGSCREYPARPFDVISSPA
jgi:hypothetical protein